MQVLLHVHMNIFWFILKIVLNEKILIELMMMFNIQLSDVIKN